MINENLEFLQTLSPALIARLVSVLRSQYGDRFATESEADVMRSDKWHALDTLSHVDYPEISGFIAGVEGARIDGGVDFDRLARLANLMHNARGQQPDGQYKAWAMELMGCISEEGE